jgi:enoyl-CoA hydratase
MSIGRRRVEKVAIVIVDRQEALNALDMSTLVELRDVLAELAADRDTRAVVLTGAGEQAFIGGADLKFMAAVDDEEARAFSKLGHEATALLETMAKPTIAAVNGFALGGGCEMALACDLRYASASATFGQPEVDYGLIPGWGGTQRLARVTGLAFAKELILTGRRIDAHEALRAGLVTEIADPVIDRALEAAALMAAKSVEALAAAKRLCNFALQGDHHANLASESDQLAHTLLTVDAREGLAAYRGRRRPVPGTA